MPMVVTPSVIHTTPTMSAMVDQEIFSSVTNTWTGPIPVVFLYVQILNSHSPAGMWLKPMACSQSTPSIVLVVYSPLAHASSWTPFPETASTLKTSPSSKPGKTSSTQMA